MNDDLWPKGTGAAVDATEKRNVVLGITGSIAAYKAAELARLLVSWGYQLRVIMTEAAQKFITPITMGTISGHSVTTDFWNEREVCDVGHVDHADWAHILVIAPASADFIAKLAMGCADTPLLAAALATRAPILIAPAMNVNMFEHPRTQENIQLLKRRGVAFVEPETGMLACGYRGAGRLANPNEIFYHVRRIISSGDLIGRRVVITTGPTREYIDPVRFISNRSSGKMGIALAREAYRRGAEVTLIHGPVPVKVPAGVRCVEVISAADMREVVLNQASGGPEESETRPADAIIMAAAVADYRPASMASEKIKKDEMTPSVPLVKNPDILADLGAKRGENRRPLLVGFAVETGEIEELLAEARRKLEHKRANMIIGNFAQDAFELDTNRAWIVDRVGRQEEIATTYKSRVANRVLDAMLRLW